jgi:hypothetical protein
MANRQVDLKKDADQVLQGIRIVLPGTQALMGFQFIAIFNPVFQNLSSNMKSLHFITLIFTIICSILLIAPVAFQQIGEDGSATLNFLSFTRKMLAAAMAFLLLSITGEVYIAGKIIDMADPWPVIISVAVFLMGGFLWFFYSLLHRKRA